MIRLSIVFIIAGCSGEEPSTPETTPSDLPVDVETTPLANDGSQPCPQGMRYIEGGTYTTGMKLPLPYGVVDTTQMEIVEAPELECPEAIAATDGATACWVQTDLHDPVVTEHEVTVDGYCISTAPFPGAGPNPADGMTTWDAQMFEQLLTLGGFTGRRLCTFTEYELAVAGPTTNRRFIYGDEPNREACARDESTDIGSMPACQNSETGVMDYGAVISQWVLNDDQLVAWACGEGRDCRASGNARLDERFEDGSFATRYLVAGGTHRVQTRQAPFTPHTFHDHGQAVDSGGCDSWGWDDGPAVCATPNSALVSCADNSDDPACQALQDQEAAWQELRQWCVGKRMTECLNRGLTALRGEEVDICPESDGELGSGQGR